MDVQVVGNVVAVVLERRWKEGQQPQAGDAQVLKIVEFLDQARKIADSVVVAVEEGADVQLIQHRIFVPERIGGEAGLLHGCPSGRRTTIPNGGSVRLSEKGRP